MRNAEHDEHAWAQPRLELLHARLLSPADEARLERHVQTCADCRDTFVQMSRLGPEPGAHVPASVLARWPRLASVLPTIERELITQHLQECDACREELRIAASAREAAGREVSLGPRVTPINTDRIWALLATAAAVCLALAWWRTPAVRDAGQPAPPAPALPVTIAPAPVLPQDVMRGSAEEPVTMAEPRGHEAVALELRPFNVADSTPVVVEVVSATGVVALRMLRTQGDLYPHRQLVLGDPRSPLPDGDYVLRLIARPDRAPADTQSARFSVRRRP